MINQQTLAPELVDLDLADSLKLYSEATNYLEAVSEFVNEVGISVEFRKSEHSSDPIAKKAEFFQNLNNLTLPIIKVDETELITGFENLTTTFLVYWINKYNLALDSIQTEVQNALGDSNIYFKPISENIGMIGKHPNFVLDNSTVPYYTSALEETLIPWGYPGTINSKVRPNSRLVSKALSLRTNALLRNNMSKLQQLTSQDQNFTSSNAHGDNLVTDLKYWYTVTEISVEVLGTIGSQFGDLARVIQFYTRYNPQDTNLNKKAASKSGYQMTDVEGAIENVDLFKKKLKTIKKTKTTDGTLSA